jgi:hypothetical protein
MKLIHGTYCCIFLDNFAVLRGSLEKKTTANRIVCLPTSRISPFAIKAKIIQLFIYLCAAIVS